MTAISRSISNIVTLLLKLKKKSSAAISRIARKAMEISGIGAEQASVEGAKKNSSEMMKDDSFFD